MLTQSYPLRRAQIALFIFGECGDQKNRNIAAAENVNDAGAASFASPAEPESYLADAAGARNHNAERRIGGQAVDDGHLLIGSKEPFRIREVSRLSTTAYISVSL